MLHCARTDDTSVGLAWQESFSVTSTCVYGAGLIIGWVLFVFLVLRLFYLGGWGREGKGRNRRSCRRNVRNEKWKVCHRFCRRFFSVACMSQKDKSTRSNTHRRGNLSSPLMDATTKVGVGFASQRQKQGSRSLACFSLSLSLSLLLDSLWYPSRPWKEE